jgi:hypothetical protein
MLRRRRLYYVRIVGPSATEAWPGPHWAASRSSALARRPLNDRRVVCGVRRFGLDDLPVQGVELVDRELLDARVLLGHLVAGVDSGGGQRAVPEQVRDFPPG